MQKLTVYLLLEGGELWCLKRNGHWIFETITHQSQIEDIVSKELRKLKTHTGFDSLEDLEKSVECKVSVVYTLEELHQINF